MQKLLTLFTIILFFSTCKKEAERAKTLEENGIKSETPALIESTFLEKANISLTPINVEEFESIPSSTAKAAKALCEKSKGYKSNTWEGLNDCSWVIEKEQILKYKDLVSRDGQQLSLKTTSGEQNFVNNADASTGSSFYQFKDYLAASQYFIVEKHTTGKCLQTKIIKQADASDHLLKGTVTPAPNGKHFLNYSAKTKDNLRCSNQLECYSFTAEGLHKNWHLPLKDKVIQELKHFKDNEVYISLLTNNKGKGDINYLRLSW